MEMRDFKGRAYFLRAYFYFYLVRLYGPVVVLPDRPFDTDEDVASVSFERSTYDECVEKICADFEEAAKLLPASRIDALQYIPTKGAALAFKARMQLYAASPLSMVTVTIPIGKTQRGGISLPRRKTRLNGEKLPPRSSGLLI